MLLSIKHLATFVGMWVLFIVIDLFWLGFVMRDFYMEALARKARIIDGVLAPHWPASLAVWFLIVFGIFFFVLPLADSWLRAGIYGAVYGLILYGVYDLTNFATLQDWPIKLVMADCVWGILLNAVISAISYKVLQFI
ncbi:MAG: hypothetical protein BWY54_00563 [Candidatus Dependentiae bacterium ADurb.Bin331]|nr:MAG: hypothetical protein BWY54_00563 [Candidatus Dependentiae bacterium ADurb.Bin331]